MTNGDQIFRHHVRLFARAGESGVDRTRVPLECAPQALKGHPPPSSPSIIPLFEGWAPAEA